MLLIDLSHTSHTRAQTGVQRVCRGLFRTLAARSQAEAITFDPFRRRWRLLEAWENQTLAATAPSRKRGSRWPARARWSGHLSRLLRRVEAPLPPATGLIVPEIFSPQVGSNLRPVFEHCTGPRVALFHDAIALSHPELTPSATVTRFPSYLQELTAFDGIAAVSDDSRAALETYWRWAGLRHTPPVRTLSLPVPKPWAAGPAATPRPVVLSVGSIEGRKNHLALLEACESLWQAGADFELELIGHVQAVTGKPAFQRIASLRAAGRPLRFHGAVEDTTLEDAYARCTFTVYPSLVEGFGLPVLESVARGKPCICSGHGALGESARGGGCLTLPAMTAGLLAGAIRRLLDDAPTREHLAAEAARRRFKTWDAYADELTGWMQTLPRRQGLWIC